MEIADFLNRKDSVTSAQKEALQCGSLFGWHYAAADSQEYYDKAVLEKTEMISGHIKDPVMYPVKGKLFQY